MNQKGLVYREKPNKPIIDSDLSQLTEARQRPCGLKPLRPKVDRGSTPRSIREDATRTCVQSSKELTTVSNASGVANLLGLGNLVRYQEPPLKKTKGNDPKWYIRPYVDVLQADGTIRRERRRFYLGSTSSVKNEDARAKRKEVLGTVNNGKQVVQAQIRFDELLGIFEQKFLYAKKNLSASTQAKYASHLKKHIRPAFGSLSIADITTQRIKDWLVAKQESGLSWSTRSDLRNLMRCIFREAIGWGLWQGETKKAVAKEAQAHG
jgi:hypothetical protein